MVSYSKLGESSITQSSGHGMSLRLLSSVNTAGLILKYVQKSPALFPHSPLQSRSSYHLLAGKLIEAHVSLRRAALAGRLMAMVKNQFQQLVDAQASRLACGGSSAPWMC